MFPKPIASTASSIEILSASVPEESYTGGHYLNITPSLVDAGSIEEWQRSTDGGATWGSTLTRASAIATTYSQTARWRVRIYNSNFGSTGPWFYLAASTVTRQGPASSPVQSSSGILLAPLAFDSVEAELESSVLLTDSVGFDDFHENAVLYSKRLVITMNYNNPAATVTAGQVNSWIDFSSVGVDTLLTNGMYVRADDITIPILRAFINFPVSGTPTPNSISIDFRGGYIDGDLSTPGQYASYSGSNP